MAGNGRAVGVIRQAGGNREARRGPWTELARRRSPSESLGMASALAAGLRRRAAHAPIYRIERRRHLLRELEAESTYLASPAAWKDPHEDPVRAALPVGSDLLARAFAQCWAGTADLDVVWRRYVPADDYALLRTTPARLSAAVDDWLAMASDWTGVIDEVEYLGLSDQRARAADLAQTWLRAGSVDPYDRAASLLFKRDPYRLEAEIRLVAIAPVGHARERGVKLRINPRHFIDAVELRTEDRDALPSGYVDELRACGFRGPVSRAEAHR